LRRSAVLRSIGAVAAASAAAAAGGQLAARDGAGGAPLFVAVATLFLLLLPYFLLGLTDLGEVLGRRVAGRPLPTAAACASLLVPYVVYGAGTGSFRTASFLKLAASIAVPAALALSASRSGPPPRWQDFAAVLAVWLPHEFRWMGDIWPWPPHAAGALNTVMGVDLIVLVFVCVRRLPDVGYRFALRRRDGLAILANLGLFLVIGIPLGTMTGFIGFHPHLPDAGVLFKAMGLFILTGLPEELLFRGLIMNLLRKLMKSGVAALVVSSLIFGAAHLNNGPRPDWRYAFLAAIAGVFYGRTYLATEGLTAPAIVHTLVDTIWGTWFK
jgi:membrane protease YdiL (CAAX protease family)